MLDEHCHQRKILFRQNREAVRRGALEAVIPDFIKIIGSVTKYVAEPLFFPQNKKSHDKLDFFVRMCYNILIKGGLFYVNYSN